MNEVSVIIVAYNCEDFIEKCIKSVLKYLPKGGEVIVLDNDSKDNTARLLEKFGKQIKLIKSDKNLGFSKGCNLAEKEASGDYLFLLNPDTELTEPVFEKLISFYEDTPNIGVLAPKLTMLDGKVQPSVKNLPTVWGAIKEYILGVKHSYSEYAPKSSEPLEVEVVYGAAMLIKKDLFQKLGRFNEKYFMYYEDTDLCRQVRDLGKKVYYLPGISIKHAVGGSKSDLDRYKLNFDSFKKYHGFFQAMLLHLIFQIPRIKRRLVS